MKHLVYPASGEQYFETVLDCGLRVRVIPKKGFSKQYAFLALDYGSIHTKFPLDGKTYTTPDGVAHYLEHKMFDMPYGDAMNRFAMLGGSPNAFTGHTMTAYYVECTEKLEENLRTLLELVFTPYFTEKSVEKERGIIAQEIRMYRDSADSRVYENLFAAVYDRHPVRVSIAGTEESIGEITVGTLELCHKAFYAPHNAMLCVMGDVKAEEIAAWAEQYTPSCPKGEKTVADLGGEESLIPSVRRTEEEMEVAMPTFVIGFKDTPPALGRESMKKEFVGDLAADLVLGSSAPLYTRLYDAGLIESAFSAGYEGMPGVSMFSVGGDSRDPDAVAEEILKETEKIKKQGADKELFSRLKKSALGRKLRELDSFENTCYRMCSYFFEGSEYYDFYEVLQSVTHEDVETFLDACLKPERMCMSVIYPKKEEK